jgi:hypothetical protein
MKESADTNLTAANLKQALWDTLKGVKSGDITPASGDVIASQAREILRTANTQLKIFAAAKESVTGELVDFANSKPSDA